MENIKLLSAPCTSTYNKAHDTFNVTANKEMHKNLENFTTRIYVYSMDMVTAIKLFFATKSNLKLLLYYPSSCSNVP